MGGIHAHHFFVFGLRDFIDAQIDRLCQDHHVTWGDTLESRCNLLRRAPHQELARRDEAELHADAVGVLDRHAEVLGPRCLMVLGLLGIERRNGGRRGIGGPTVPAGLGAVGRVVALLRDLDLRSVGNLDLRLCAILVRDRDDDHTQQQHERSGSASGEQPPR